MPRNFGIPHPLEQAARQCTAYLPEPGKQWRPREPLVELDGLREPPPRRIAGPIIAALLVAAAVIGASAIGWP